MPFKYTTNLFSHIQTGCSVIVLRAKLLLLREKNKASHHKSEECNNIN